MRVFLIAGELSGDKLGAALMKGLVDLHGDVTFEGVGGPQMQALGLSSQFDMSELSVMGLVEILPKYRQLKRRITQTAKAILQSQPDVLITIDSPDFCLRVARKVKQESNIRTVHYVAPSVWAWRPGRAAKMAPYIDQVLALLPFEVPFMETVGMRCDFVGHPVVAEPVVSAAQVARFRAKHIFGDAPVLLVLPGSRRTEVTRLSPVFGDVLGKILTSNPTLKIVVPAAAPVVALVQDLAKNWPGSPLVLDPRDQSASDAEDSKRVAFKAANIALAASGTVSLELAAAATPMVIAYDMNWLSWQIMSRMAKIDTVTLVNLITDSRTIPEFLGPECQPDAIAAALNGLLKNADQRQRQVDAMATTMTALGSGNTAPGHRAAQAVIDGLVNT
ncbi:MAG: lipid-A-disaccharide synthase [Paracoccaceae bacterium]